MLAYGLRGRSDEGSAAKVETNENSSEAWTPWKGDVPPHPLVNENGSFSGQMSSEKRSTLLNTLQSFCTTKNLSVAATPLR